MDLENVLGIVISKDGEMHPFGKFKLAEVSELSEENFHDPSFKNEVVPSQWFQDLESNLENFYDSNQTLRKQIFDMTNYHGLTFLLNANNLKPDNEPFYCYTIQCPFDLSDETRECLENNYDYLKNLIDRQQALFEGEPYLDGAYIWNESAYNIDDFYDKMGLAKGGIKGKGGK